MNKEYKRYFFMVETEIEKLYFDRLQKLINESDKSKYNVNIITIVQPSAMKYATTGKPVNASKETDESNNIVNNPKLQELVLKMKEINPNRRKKYNIGYGNYSFELWMLLHKQMCNEVLSDKTKYLKDINNSYDVEFNDLEEFNDNFKYCLDKINLNNVEKAIERSKQIMNNKIINEDTQEQCKNIPTLTIWEYVEEILTECGLL